jgi:hypothetical protein
MGRRRTGRSQQHKEGQSQAEEAGTEAEADPEAVASRQRAGSGLRLNNGQRRCGLGLLFQFFQCFQNGTHDIYL